MNLSRMTLRTDEFRLDYEELCDLCFDFEICVDNDMILQYCLGRLLDSVI